MKKIKTLIIELSKRNKFFRGIVRGLIKFFRRCRYLLYMLKYKTDDKVILFEVFGGKNYTCSPKAIYEKMLKLDEFKDYKFIWAFTDINKHDVLKDKRTIIIKSGSKDYLKYLSTAKYWIVNSIIPQYVIKKKNQIYVQCWHGTPLKRLRYDIEVDGAIMNTIKEIRKRNDEDAKRFDYFISSSAFSSEKFTSAFNLVKLGKKDIIIEEGYPRNDSLFNRSKKDIDKIKEKLNLPKDKKIILYPPTFRDNQYTSGMGYTYETVLDFDRLKEKLSKDYIILFRPHYFVANNFDFDKYKGFIYNVNDYDEINDLYLISDIIMTDYSSVFFDYANLKKPMIFYMYDLDLYKGKLRDFYISLDELPGPITKTQDELERAIKNIDKEFNKYKDKYDRFNKKYNYLDDGDASYRVIKKIFKEVYK